jgi:hypothetical protein
MFKVEYGRAMEALSRWFLLLTGHYAIQVVDHVGPFAGSLLERKDWDHN